MELQSYISGTGAVVHAVQVTQDNIHEAAEFARGEPIEIKTDIMEIPFAYKGIRYETYDGVRWVQIGDWIVRYKVADTYIYGYTNTVFRMMFKPI